MPSVPRDFARVFALVVGVAFLAVIAPLVVREIRRLPEASSLAARSGQRIVTLEVAGMTCTACEAAVKGGLATVPGVTASEVRHRQGRAYVVVDRATPDSALTGAIRAAGAGFRAWVVAQ